MNSDERRKLVRNYNDLLKKKQKWEKVKSEYEELMKDPNVKRFIELGDIIDNCSSFNYYTTSKDDDLLYTAYMNTRIESEKKIYICLGGRRINHYIDIEHGSNDYYDDKNPDYYLYEAVEGYCDTEQIRPDKKDAFEKDKIILQGDRFNVHKIKIRYASLVVTEGIIKAKKIIQEEYGSKK